MYYLHNHQLLYTLKPLKSYRPYRVPLWWGNFNRNIWTGKGRGEVCECVWAKTVRKDQVLPGAVCLLEEQLHPGLLEVPGSTGSWSPPSPWCASPSPPWCSPRTAANRGSVWITNNVSFENMFVYLEVSEPVWGVEAPVAGSVLRRVGVADKLLGAEQALALKAFYAPEVCVLWYIFVIITLHRVFVCQTIEPLVMICGTPTTGKGSARIREGPFWNVLFSI